MGASQMQMTLAIHVSDLWISRKLCPYKPTIWWRYFHRFRHWCWSVTLICDGRTNSKVAPILQKSVLPLHSDIRTSMKGTMKPSHRSSYSLFRTNRGTGVFLKSTGQDRVVTCVLVDELLIRAWELNNGRKTEGGIYRKGQAQKTMKIKFVKNFCRQLRELATTNR
jgi:hypothetical protein